MSLVSANTLILCYFRHVHDFTCLLICARAAPNVEVTVTEKTTSIKKEKVTVIGDQETRVVENSPTFTETLLPVTEVNEGSHVRYVDVLLQAR
jgi:hypothetical protein